MGAINAVTDLTAQGDVAVLTVNSPPVNALSQQVRDGIVKGMQQAIGDAAVKAVVLICDGRTFIAGADITEFGKPPQAPSLHDVCDTIENSPKPVVAAIHGTALGGGLETALCCHYRVAVPSAKCGLPEVHLGLLPGAGGTQRLPRIVGPEQALQMVTSGAHVDAKTSHAAGLLDEIVPEGELRAGAIAYAKKVIAEKRPLRKVREMNEKVEAARGKPELFAEFRKANARKFRGFLAPEYNIRCIEAAVNLPFDQGIATERKLFMELMTGTQSAAQRYVFFAERQVWKIPDVPDDTATIPVKKVGVIGAGTMGGGISMNFANVGIPVTIVEVKQDALDRGLGVIRKNYDTTAKRGKLKPEDVEKRMGLLTGTLDFQALADCDLVIEAVFENMDIKKDVFAQARRHRQAGRDPGHQHFVPGRQRDRERDQAAGGGDRPALLLAGERDAAAGDRARREDLQAGHRHLDAAREEDRQDRRAGRRLPRLRRQPHAVPAPAAGAGDAPGRRDAVGRRPGAVRLRLADGTVRDVRPRRPRHRLEQGDLEGRDDARSAVRDGPPRPEDRRRLLRLRRRAQRQALARHREDHQGLHGEGRRDARARFPTRRSSSAASIR